MINSRVEQVRDGENERMGTHWPDHFAPMTWHRCITEGCQVRVDPWKHRTRCDEHQADADAKLERVRAIVEAHREAEAARRYRQLVG